MAGLDHLRVQSHRASPHMDNPHGETPGPPEVLCDKCGNGMRLVASLPIIGAVRKFTKAYQCRPCDLLRWIKD